LAAGGKTVARQINVIKFDDQGHEDVDYSSSLPRKK
jgi:hypothetical protein